MNHPKKDAALNALSDLWNDKTLSPEQALEALEDIRDEIEERCAAIVETLGE